MATKKTIPKSVQTPEISPEIEAFLVDSLMSSLAPHVTARAVKKEYGVTLTSNEVMAFYSSYSARLLTATKRDIAGLSDANRDGVYIEVSSYEDASEGLILAHNALLKTLVSQSEYVCALQAQKIRTGELYQNSEVGLLKQLTETVGALQDLAKVTNNERFKL